MQSVLKLVCVTALGCTMLGASGQAKADADWVEWVLDLGVEYRHEDNLNLSAFDADERSDSAVGVELQAGRYLQMGDQT